MRKKHTKLKENNKTIMKTRTALVQLQRTDNQKKN